MKQKSIEIFKNLQVVKKHSSSFLCVAKTKKKHNLCLHSSNDLIIKCGKNYKTLLLKHDNLNYKNLKALIHNVSKVTTKTSTSTVVSRLPFAQAGA